MLSFVAKFRDGFRALTELRIPAVVVTHDFSGVVGLHGKPTRIQDGRIVEVLRFRSDFGIAP